MAGQVIPDSFLSADSWPARLALDWRHSLERGLQ
jgi:hypothetical protein